MGAKALDEEIGSEFTSFYQSSLEKTRIEDSKILSIGFIGWLVYHLSEYLLTEAEASFNLKKTLESNLD